MGWDSRKQSAGLNPNQGHSRRPSATPAQPRCHAPPLIAQMAPQPIHHAPPPVRYAQPPAAQTKPITGTGPKCGPHLAGSAPTPQPIRHAPPPVRYAQRPAAQAKPVTAPPPASQSHRQILQSRNLENLSRQHVSLASIQMSKRDKKYDNDDDEFIPSKTADVHVHEFPNAVRGGYLGHLKAGGHIISKISDRASAELALDFLRINCEGVEGYDEMREKLIEWAKYFPKVEKK